MGEFRIEVEPSAQVEIQFHLKSGNKAVIKRLRKFLLN